MARTREVKRRPGMVSAWPETHVLEFLVLLVLENKQEFDCENENDDEDDPIPAVSGQTLLMLVPRTTARQPPTTPSTIPAMNDEQLFRLIQLIGFVMLLVIRTRKEEANLLARFVPRL